MTNGDRVLYQDGPHDDGVQAIVLKIVGETHCLIQMDPSRFARTLDIAKANGPSPDALALVDQFMALKAEFPIDTQEPFEVESKDLTYLDSLEGEEEEGPS